MAISDFYYYFLKYTSVCGGRTRSESMAENVVTDQELRGQLSTAVNVAETVGNGIGDDSDSVGVVKTQ
jgi:hypothetical protein